MPALGGRARPDGHSGAGAFRSAGAARRTGPRGARPAVPASHVDHRHRTGKVRGVLCFDRDAARGEPGDDPGSAGRTAAYSEGNPWKPTLVAPGVCQLPS
ncbi:endonuclease domain-containing protein [Streptomyces yaizuensis]|uniref:endonuclease domain-containing protein n=1 Tax=Streptomyces yaizuensis TaxID=2989713 RepID=UPI002B1F9395|nr:endonuclease domain-containing protein [Streptomyces sp. YSPA8]